MYLSNSKTKCQEWQIADVNHDNTDGTVDLVSKYILIDYTYTDVTYANSRVRRLLNDSSYDCIYDGFSSTIKNAIAQQAVYSYYSTIYDMVKCPSINELGCNWTAGGHSICGPAEGTIYPLFGNTQRYPNPNAIRKLDANSSEGSVYWTRSRNNTYTNIVCCIQSAGAGLGDYNGDYIKEYGVIGIIRFAKK